MRPLTLALLAGAALLLPASASTASVSCSPINQGFETAIVAINVPCSTAHGVAHGWHLEAMSKNSPFAKHKVGHFVCHSRKTDPEHVRVTCTNVRLPTHHVLFSSGP